METLNNIAQNMPDGIFVMIQHSTSSFRQLYITLMAALSFLTTITSSTPGLGGLSIDFINVTITKTIKDNNEVSCYGLIAVLIMLLYLCMVVVRSIVFDTVWIILIFTFVWLIVTVVNNFAASTQVKKTN